MARTVVFLAAIAWLACVAMSLVALTAWPEGDGFLRGLNRVEDFLSWQVAALAVSVAGAVALRFVPPPVGRREKLFGLGPLAVSGLLAVGLIVLVAWATWSRPPPAPPVENPPTVTAPA